MVFMRTSMFSMLSFRSAMPHGRGKAASVPYVSCSSSSVVVACILPSSDLPCASDAMLISSLMFQILYVLKERIKFCGTTAFRGH